MEEPRGDGVKRSFGNCGFFRLRLRTREMLYFCFLFGALGEPPPFHNLLPISFFARVQIDISARTKVYCRHHDLAVSTGFGMERQGVYNKACSCLA